MIHPPLRGATKTKQKETTGKHTRRSTAQGTGSIHAPRTSTPSPPRTQRRSTKKDKKGAKKVAGRFVAIISSTAINSGEEDNISPLGTDDESESTKAVRAMEESAGSRSESDSEVTLKIRTTALERERERMRKLEQGFRAAHPFTPHRGSRVRHREQSWEEAEDNERPSPRIGATPRARQRWGTDREIREQGNLVLTNPRW